MCTVLFLFNSNHWYKIWNEMKKIALLSTADEITHTISIKHNTMYFYSMHNAFILFDAFFLGLVFGMLLQQICK